jgi:hypothetical protein
MFKNCEGYPDPTAGRAFANIARDERKAKAATNSAAMTEAEAGAARKKRRHPIRRKKNNWRPKIGVMRW